MRRLVFLIAFCMLIMSCAIAEEEMDYSLIGEWHAGSILYGASRLQEDVKVYDDYFECEGYSFYVDQAKLGEGLLRIIGNDDQESIKGYIFEVSNKDSFLVCWENDDNLYGYYFTNEEICYKVNFNNEKMLFLEDEIYIKSEKQINDRNKSEIEKANYLYYGNEFYLIEEDIYTGFDVIGITDKVAVLMGRETVARVQGGIPIKSILVLVRTSAIR